MHVARRLVFGQQWTLGYITTWKYGKGLHWTLGGYTWNWNWTKRSHSVLMRNASNLCT